MVSIFAAEEGPLPSHQEMDSQKSFEGVSKYVNESGPEGVSQRRDLWNIIIYHPSKDMIRIQHSSLFVDIIMCSG